MRRVLKDTWTIFTQSVKEMTDPNQRALWMVGFVGVVFIMTLILLAVVTGFIENLFEIIGNVITQTVIGEYPDPLVE